jgi:hypothetical protein
VLDELADLLLLLAQTAQQLVMGSVRVAATAATSASATTAAAALQH